MVLLGSEEHGGAKSTTTAPSPKRSSRLHNFSLPFFKWGKQRRMRYAAVTTTADRNSDESGTGGEDAISAVRQKLILDLKTEADRMKDMILRSEEEEGEEATRPWNLRKRRARVANQGNLSLPEKQDGVLKHDCSLKHDGGASKRVKFALELSKKEIEEDFLAMVGHRPPRRVKRPKHIQRQLDMNFPGSWLTEVTPVLYKVPEMSENGKGRQNGKSKVDVGF